MYLKMSCLDVMGRFDEVKVLWPTLLCRPLNKNSVYVLYNYIVDYLFKGPATDSYDVAINLCQKAEEMPSTRAFPFYDMLRAMAYAKKGDFDRAMKYMQNALNAESKNIEDKMLASFYYADVLNLQEEYAKAVDVLMPFLSYECRSQSRLAEVVLKLGM
jgi:tetratricopeptide (TPR) repeat protein